MAKKKSVKGARVAVAKSIEKAAEFVGKIGEHQRKLTQIKTRVNNQIEKITAQAMKDGSPHQEAISQLFEAIFNYADKNRDKLTKEGKTISLPTGIFRWRFTKRAISIEDEEKFIIQCKKVRSLKRFIRVTVVEEPNKEMMLEEAEIAAGIKGVTIGRKEKFEVVPAEVKITISRETGKLEKVLPKK